MLQSLVTAALSIAAVMPSGVAVAADATVEAERLRRMDIMLMVTGLRCRAPADNFRALDKMRFAMANEYGGGRPWLSCHELRQVTKSLALVQGHDTLVEAASQLLERKPQPLLALAGR